jgi:hypothetical protein
MRARRISCHVSAALVFVACVLQPATAQTDAPAWPAVQVLSDVQLSPQGQGSARIFVTDAAGRPRMDVTPDDLTIRFGGLPVTGVQVQAKKDMPIHVVLGLDVSLWNANDARHTDALTSTVLAIKQMVEAIPNSHFVAFPFSTTVMQPATHDVAWLQGPRLWGGTRTAFYAAVDHAARQFVDASDRRRVIILLTNSGNTLNVPPALARRTLDNTAATAINSALKAGAPLYVFAAEERGHPLSKDRLNELSALVKATGGVTSVISASNVSQLPSSVLGVLDDLKMGYLVTFTATARVDAPQSLEIGLAPARTATYNVGAQKPIFASLQASTPLNSPDDIVTLNADQTWAKDIRSVQVFVDGAPVLTLAPTALSFTLEALKAQIQAAKPGASLVLSATVDHGLNRISVPTMTLPVPALPILNMNVPEPTHAGIAIQPDQVFTVKVPNTLGQVFSNITYVLTDAQGTATTYEKDSLIVSGATLAKDAYMLQARAVDVWGRRVVSEQVPVVIDHGLPLLVRMVILLFAVLAVVLIPLWFVERQRRREAARMQETYRLVNYGNEATKLIVQAVYRASDLHLDLGLMDVSTPEIEHLAEGRLRLTTPEIAPRDHLLLRVSIEPVRVGVLETYDFDLIVRAAPQDPTDDQSRPFKLTPLLRAANPSPSA